MLYGKINHGLLLIYPHSTGVNLSCYAVRMALSKVLYKRMIKEKPIIEARDYS